MVGGIVGPWENSIQPSRMRCTGPVHAELVVVRFEDVVSDPLQKTFTEEVVVTAGTRKNNRPSRI
eukprot:4303841-Prorocentrum_lima.AAC.1